MASRASVLQKLKFRSESNTTHHGQPVLVGNDANAFDSDSLAGETHEFPDSTAKLLLSRPTRSGSTTQRSLSSGATTILDHPTYDRRVLASQDSDLDPIGLHLVHKGQSRKGDIIFVHGLGGCSFKTWSWHRNVDNFWPTWLTQHEEFATWRIFSFGYNSNWKGGPTNLNVSDFAKELLLQMLTFTEDGSAATAMGNAPIIFVAHSMGGLVVKKAYLLGKQDGQFAALVSWIRGTMFLATPHPRYAVVANPPKPPHP
ncbi:MAG: hypothetical protein M1820_009871 [Bogoriella megaspora]|nr:MAG: hypothetical protein M1820_009871 [Bogoriella megaspora]